MALTIDGDGVFDGDDLVKEKLEPIIYDAATNDGSGQQHFLVEDHVDPDVNDDGSEDEPTTSKQKWLQGTTEPRMMVYVNDMIELTDGTTSMVAREERMDAMSITDKGILEMRHVNRKVLRHAPCSVGVAVDRGLRSTQLSREIQCISATIIFIVGNDDREALAYASRVARHPGVKLIVVRFLLDTNGNNVSSRITRAKANTTKFEEEMKQDDEYFIDFYE
ncbi:hypothetical protein Tco_0639731 [Tanacetum coccineum]